MRKNEEWRPKNVKGLSKVFIEGGEEEEEEEEEEENGDKNGAPPEWLLDFGYISIFLSPTLFSFCPHALRTSVVLR